MNALTKISAGSILGQAQRNARDRALAGISLIKYRNLSSI
jgi:hypothetical protein